jgi:uncharacterized protein with PIN domain
MRRVHEILRGRSGKHEVVISFVQHGTKEDGFLYENICPWCGGTIEKVSANPDAEMSVVANRLREGMSRHIWTCTHRNSYVLQVEQTTTPLDTEKIVREQ